MTLDCSKNQSHPQGHGGLPTTKYVKISVPQVRCLNSYKRLPLQGPLSDKTVLAEVLPWPDIQGSGVIGLQAPTVGESLWTVVAIMKWMESETGGQTAPLMGDDAPMCLNSEGPPGKVGCLSDPFIL